jgi:hypothetical protein
MSEFKTGQWAICDGACVQIEQHAYRRGLMVCRIAGSDRRKCISIKRLTPSSLIPDFSNAKVGESCFDVELEHCEISEVREYDVYTRLMVDDGKGNLNPHIIYKDGYAHNPLLFNSFAQFQAYWAEKVLVRELTGTKGDES